MQFLDDNQILWLVVCLANVKFSQKNQTQYDYTVNVIVIPDKRCIVMS